MVNLMHSASKGSTEGHFRQARISSGARAPARGTNTKTENFTNAQSTPNAKALPARARPDRPKAGQTKPSQVEIIRRVQKAPIDRRCYLLNLPAELRNEIYKYVIDERAVEIRPAPSPSKTRSVTLQHPSAKYKFHQTAKIFRTSLVLGKSKKEDRRTTEWKTSIGAIALTCRQFNREANYFLYGKRTFVLETRIRIYAFLTTVQPMNKEAIRSVRLIHHTEGEPHVQRCRTTKTGSDKNWDRTCQMLAKDLKGLEILEIILAVHELPLKFTLGEAWVRPLLHFSEIDLKSFQIMLLLPRSSASFSDSEEDAFRTFTNALKLRVLEPMGHAKKLTVARLSYWGETNSFNWVA